MEPVEFLEDNYKLVDCCNRKESNFPEGNIIWKHTFGESGESYIKAKSSLGYAEITQAVFDNPIPTSVYWGKFVDLETQHRIEFFNGDPLKVKHWCENKMRGLK